MDPATDTTTATDSADMAGSGGAATDSESFAFDFKLEDTEGNTVSKADFAGKVIIADIWGTWCPPCREEIPHFVELQKEYCDKGLQIVGLTDEKNDDKEEALSSIRAFTETQPVNYPLLLVNRETISQVPDFRGYPTTIFIDRKGEVRLKVVGYTEKSELEAIVKRLLDEA